MMVLEVGVREWARGSWDEVGSLVISWQWVITLHHQSEAETDRRTLLELARWPEAIVLLACACCPGTKTTFLYSIVLLLLVAKCMHCNAMVQQRVRCSME